MKGFLSYVLVAFGLCILLTGCGKGSSDDRNKSDEDKNNIEEEMKTITWVNLFYQGISSDNQQKINRILQEKGIEYQIRFVLPSGEDGSPLTGAEYAEWVKRKEDALDIITSGAWPGGDDTVIEFVERQMTPLNTYLGTSDGKVLKEFFTDEEWKGCSLNENKYVIPSAVIGSTDDYGLDAGVYASVNEKYKEYFAGFDGTYASLKQIYKTIGDKNLHFVIAELPSAQELFGLLGYSTLQSTIPFSEAEQSVVDITKTDELPDLLRELYEDMKSGILVYQGWGSEVPEDQVLVYIYSRKRNPREGFVDYQIAPGSNELNLRAKYGISVNSKKKDVAFKIITMCFTDPDILCLLYSGVDRELVLHRKDFLLSNVGSEAAGINLRFDEKQAEAIQKFSNGFLVLINAFQQRKDNVDESDYVFELNQVFDIEAEWNIFLESIGLYSDLCESVNQQIRKWMESK